MPKKTSQPEGEILRYAVEAVRRHGCTMTDEQFDALLNEPDKVREDRRSRNNDAEVQRAKAKGLRVVTEDEVKKFNAINKKLSKLRRD